MRTRGFRASLLLLALVACLVPDRVEAQRQRLTYPTICLAKNLRLKRTTQETRRQCVTLKAHIDSINGRLVAITPPPKPLPPIPNPEPTTPPVTTPPVTPPPVTPPVVTPPVTPPPVVIPPPVIVPPPVTGSNIAELPRVVPVVTYPTGLRRVVVSAGSDLQAAINAALPGDEINLPLGATWIGNFDLPVKAGSAYIVIRTDTTLTTGARIRPSTATRLAKILTPNYSPAIQALNGSHHWRLDGLEIGTTTAARASGVNTVVKFGDAVSNGQNTVAKIPHDLILARSYVHGDSLLNLKRCVTVNSATTSVVDSWLGDCHDHGSDSQAILGYNGPGPFLIANNHLESGHEVVMWGGSDPITNLTPSDVTLVNNHITRPASWKGVWQTKNVLETKNVQRYDIQANVIENTWKDAQAGFCLVMKSENQDGTAPWSTSADITVRYNLIRNCGSGFNLSGMGSSPAPNIHAARFTIYDNLITGLNASPYSGDGIGFQILSDLSDAVITHNTITASGGMLNALSFDGPPANRLIFSSNVVPVGLYGVKGGGTGSCTPTLTVYAPGYSFQTNAIIGANVYPNSCATYPSGTTCPATAAGSAARTAHDGRATIGADTLLVQQLTTGVVVAP